MICLLYTSPLYGNILAEVPAECIADLEVPCEVIGEVSAEPTFIYGEIVISMDEAVKSWKSTLEKVFPSVSGKTQPKVDTGIYKADSIYVCKNKVEMCIRDRKKAPFYRVVVADQRSPRDGRFIAEIGYYDPTKEPSVIKFDEEAAKQWLANGAQPTRCV